VIGFTILVCALLTLVHMLAKVMLGPTKRVIGKLLNYNGYVNIIVGTGITFAVHSSTVVTSTLTPMAGLGVISLEQVYPIVIGANLGTTATALLAALVAAKPNATAIALVHFWFNVFGIFLFYPIPMTRQPIYSWAKALAYASACWAMSAVIFLVCLFLVIPGVMLVLAYLCTASSTATQVVGYILSGLTLIGFVGALFWYHKKGGSEKWHAFLLRKSAERDARKGIQTDDGHKV
jgi:sodium-dependent phosphate cotransporter